jgi:hypothetical protein
MPKYEQLIYSNKMYDHKAYMKEYYNKNNAKIKAVNLQ